jgi:flavin-dependent dehydrogenase
LNFQFLHKSEEIIIIGGGLGGLITSILLARNGFNVRLIEKKEYPFHRVCGEYVSNEVAPFLKSIDCFPKDTEIPQIDRFILSSVTGKYASIKLDLGGFGISRYYFDSFLYKKALESGVQVNTKTSIEKIHKEGDHFILETERGERLKSQLLIAAHGKKSKIDLLLDRPFLKAPSNYVGVKYHLNYDVPDNEIQLHNFEGGYCGVSKVENNIVNMCYLSRFEPLRALGSVEKLEQRLLHANPFLRKIFNEADFIFDKPMVINQFSFTPKSPVEQGIFMVGDAAGLITPLCGNGMSLAIHSSKVLVDSILASSSNEQVNLSIARKSYAAQWNKLFSARLRNGRFIQGLFGKKGVSRFATEIIRKSKPIARQIIRSTHGSPF